MSPRNERNAFQPVRRDNNLVHPSRPNNANDDFFTDSLLDTSRIPTPSPSKKQVKSASASRPRRALGNTRTLRAAWDATAGSGPLSSTGDNLRSLQDKSKPAPAPRRGRSPVNPVKAQPISSPPRPRQSSLPIASPNSDASSPPRGLNDVYQRIADEERLAAQEGEVVEDDFTNSTMSQDDYVDDDRMRVNRIRSSQSPLTFRSSSRNAPQAPATEVDKENHSDHNGLTDVSGMSFLENMTDQVLAAKLTPHAQDRARDRARLDKAIQKTTPLAFSKAQVGSRHALTSENLRRSGRGGEYTGSLRSSSNGSIRNEDINPPPNVPRTWGSKGRIEKDWLRKIHDRNASPADGTSADVGKATPPIDWTAAAAEVPLPSLEASLTPRREDSRHSTPASLSKQTSLDRIRQWELNDFTGNNLQVSDSPPVRVRGNLPDNFRDREIETLEKRAVTTSRLGEIRKMNSRELLMGKPRSTDLEAHKVEDQPSPENKDAIITTIEEGDGEPIPDTPIVVYKASTNGVKERENAKGHPVHDRRDSRDSLQRLARAISESPRPSSTPEEWSLIKEEAESATPVNHKSERLQHASRKPSKDESRGLFVRRSRSADAARTPIVTGAWTDTILPDTIKTVKQRQAPSKYAQTPHVTGGWVDTPAPHAQRQSSAIVPNPIEERPGEPTTIDLIEQDPRGPENVAIDTNPATKRPPNLPRALSNLLTKAKRKIATRDQHSPTTEEEEANTDTLNLGDATIESLEDLLTLDNADMTTLLRMGAEFEAREDLGPDKGGGVATETELLERLGTKLERLKTNIHDARKGISKLEHQVSLPSEHSNTGASVDKLGNGQLLASPCQACGCVRAGPASPSSSNAKLYLTIPIPQFHFPRLWYPSRSYSSHDAHPLWSRLPRLTPIGWFTLGVWLWYVSESVLCARYCHPEFAEYYTWPDRGQRGRRERYGGDLEPRWGWILWTLLRRSWMGGLGRLIWLLLRLAARWVGMLAGWTDGFASEAMGTTNHSAAGVGPGVGHGVSVSGGGNDVVLDTTMVHDEFL